MTTKNNIITLEQAMFIREQKHKQAGCLLQMITKAQMLIEDSAKYRSDDRKHLSYYKVVAERNMRLIEKYAAIRNYLINRYNNLLWQLYRADLPIFATTSIQEISVTLYSAQHVKGAVA